MARKGRLTCLLALVSLQLPLATPFLAPLPLRAAPGLCAGAVRALAPALPQGGPARHAHAPAHSPRTAPAAASSRTAMQCEPGGEKFTGVRFSIYPKGEHIKEVIKAAMANITSLGLIAKPDDVSTVLIGEEARLFEAARVAFGRCCAGGRHVSMQATFSAGCPGEDPFEPAPRTIPTEMEEEEGGWIRDAVHPLKGTRVAAQFALYPLGLPNYMDIIYREIAVAKASGVWKGQKTHFCSMLDGDGDEVFKVLRQCFDNARRDGGHVVMTATLMTNKRAWKESK